MNKKRVNFNQPENHTINITPYWLVGFVEAEGYFSVSSINHKLIFGIGQSASDLNVLVAIKEFLLGLPGKYRITRADTNPINISVDRKAKNQNSKPMAKIEIAKTDFITNILVPFFDNYTWYSKKVLDYKDWKVMLIIKKRW